MVCESESQYNAFYPITVTNTIAIGECELPYHNKIEGQNPTRKCINSVWEEADSDVCEKYKFPKVDVDFSEVVSTYIADGADRGKIEYSGNIVLKTDNCDKSLLPIMFVFVKFDSKSGTSFDGIAPANVSYCFPGNRVAVAIPRQIVAYNFYNVSVGVFGTKKMGDADKLVIDSFSIYYYIIID